MVPTQTLDLGAEESLLGAWLEQPFLADERAEGAPVSPDEMRALLPAGERYTLGDELGRGGMGSVVLARDNLLGRTVALKRLISARPDLEELQRFLLEAQVTGQLEHPNIVQVHEVGVDEAGRPYFTMHYVRGNETLEHVIERLREGDLEYHRRYSFERRVQIIQQVARALEFAHQHGVVHRDIKPANIMVGPFGEVLLLDWGLARLIEREEDQATLLPPVGPLGERAVTEADRLLGTPFYMAPEQFSEDAHRTSDVFSLVAVLQEFLSLTHYLGEPKLELSELAEQILHQEPVPADAEFDGLNGRVPAALALICSRGLRKAPGARYQSAGQLADALQGWLEGRCEVGCPNSLSLSLLHRWRRALENHPKPATLLTLSLAFIFLFSVAFSLTHLIP